MTVSKDQTIIIQVAGKIAADIIPKTDDVLSNVASWAIAFDAVVDGLFDKMGFGTVTVSPPATEAMIVETFNATVVPVQAPAPQYAPATGTVRVKGTQHGPLPEWLASEASKKGVFEVWDNREGLAINPKRPWFRSTTGDVGFWPPKAK